MNILAIESSGLVASAAVIEDELLKAEFTINNKLTHSETLLPMIRRMYDISGLKLEDTDAIAVSAGPGSFTGLRIGAATAKGLALALNLPVISVSSLQAMAYGLCQVSDACICPIMDARREQVYSAAYCNGATLLTEAARDIHDYLAELRERALTVGATQENAEDLSAEKTILETATAAASTTAAAQPVAEAQPETASRAPSYIFIGDGVPVYADTITADLEGDITFASASYNRQRAALVAELGAAVYAKWLAKNNLTAEEVRDLGADSINCFDDKVMNSDTFVPIYLRKTQAEREKAAGILQDAGKHSLSKMQDKGRTRRA